jgi:hypothetical protein
MFSASVDVVAEEDFFADVGGRGADKKCRFLRFAAE